MHRDQKNDHCVLPLTVFNIHVLYFFCIKHLGFIAFLLFRPQYVFVFICVYLVLLE